MYRAQQSHAVFVTRLSRVSTPCGLQCRRTCGGGVWGQAEVEMRKIVSWLLRGEKRRGA
jgi:hypothetical protein